MIYSIVLLGFLLLGSSRACSSVECRACIDDKSDTCVWCADGGGACVEANSTAASACTRMPDDSFQQCPDLERRDAAILGDVFRTLRSATEHESWTAYLDELIDDVANFRCPRPPPRTTINSGFSCVNGHIWTFQLDPQSVPRPSGSARSPQLSGSIHASFANLSELRVFSLKDHLLSGAVPPLNGMRSLTSVTLNANQFSGRFPPIDRLVNLEEFWINNNAFDGPLPALPDAPQLKVVHFENNRFSGQLPDLSKLVSLVIFNVNRNRLSGVPPALPPSIKSCSWGSPDDVEQNCFQTANCTAPCACPANVANCHVRPSDRAALSTVLRALHNQSEGAWDFSVHLSELANGHCPSGAPIDGIAEQAFTCAGGRVVGLKLAGKSADNVEKQMPLEIGQLDALEDLSLPSLSLAGVFPSLEALTSLKFLDLSDNYLESPLDLGAAGALQFLFLKLNRFRSLPDLSALPQLRVLEVQQNLLSQRLDTAAFAGLTQCTLGATTAERNCFLNDVCPKPCVCPPNVLSCKPASAASTTAAATESTTEPLLLDGNPMRRPHQESAGAIAGYSVMGVALFLTILMIVYCLIRQNRKKGEAAFQKFPDDK